LLRSSNPKASYNANTTFKNPIFADPKKLGFIESFSRAPPILVTTLRPKDADSP
jgi:hypothetical protein